MSGVVDKENIVIYNACENNLKNVNVKIPLGKFTCVTGPSGCGKSSLVYDTLYAESQRNFIESMSGNLYGQKIMDKPNVGKIDNLRPALNVAQTSYNVNPRSTIGTISDVSYYLRAVFALYANEEYGLNVDSNFFSANNPESCCLKCKGMGEEYIVSENKLIPDENKSLLAGGIIYYKGNKTSLEFKLLEAICNYYNIDIRKSFSQLTSREKTELLYRTEEVNFPLKFKTIKGRYKSKDVKSKGVITELKEKLDDIDTPSTFASISKYLEKSRCTCCNGKKLKSNILDIRINGFNISEIEELSLESLLEWIDNVKITLSEKNYSKQINQLFDEIKKKVKYMIDLKLEYLQIGRNIPSLSGGELQRIRIANQLACSLNGLIYILDEPCKGLHYKNIDSIIKATKELITKGNTVVSIEHNKQYVSAADKVIELGPVGGPEGGYIITENVSKDIFMSNVKFKKSYEPKRYIEIEGINYHNLKNVNVKIPIGKVTCISGVSGAGKSSLTDVIIENCDGNKPVKCKKVINPITFNRVLNVNQQPIGKTPRSTVVSYLGIYDEIREIFASIRDAKEKGLTSSDFSMNVVGGRCECCQGTGKKKIELSYMPDSYIVCPDCGGKRFKDDILQVKYKENSINDILNKPIYEIAPLFADKDGIYRMMECVNNIGIGYLSLGQMSMNLSGGEAQRIKLAKCLGVKSSGNNLYILDEPTSGLNEKDIELFKSVIFDLASKGETIIIIEHNLDFISQTADYIIDLGDKPGDKRNPIIIMGLPYDVIKNKESSWNEMII